MNLILCLYHQDMAASRIWLVDQERVLMKGSAYLFFLHTVRGGLSKTYCLGYQIALEEARADPYLMSGWSIRGHSKTTKKADDLPSPKAHISKRENFVLLYILLRNLIVSEFPPPQTRRSTRTDIKTFPYRGPPNFSLLKLRSITEHIIPLNSRMHGKQVVITPHLNIILSSI